MKGRILFNFVFLFCLSIVQFLRQLVSKEGGNKKALVYIRTINIARNLPLLTKMLGDAGFRIFLNMSLDRKLRMDSFARKAFRDSAIAFTGGTEGFDLIVVDDRKEVPRFPYAKVLVLDFNIFSPRLTEEDKKENIFFPISFFPDLLVGGNGSGLPISSETGTGKRKMKIFFAGTTDKEYYNQKETKKYFHINTRHEILTFLYENVEEDKLIRPKTYGEFRNLLDGGALRDKIVICETGQFKIPTTEWMNVMSEADFFLSPPGYVQPYCHNTVEALSVGSVPILQYAGVYFPPLSHEENCLVFKDLEDLLALVRLVLDGGEDGLLATMRAGARTYFESFLSPRYFKNKLDEFLGSGVQSRRLILNRSHESVRLLEQEIGETL